MIRIAYKSYWSYEVRDDEMGVSYSTHGGDVNTGVSWGKVRKIWLGRPGRR